MYGMMENSLHLFDGIMHDKTGHVLYHSMTHVKMVDFTRVVANLYTLKYTTIHV